MRHLAFYDAAMSHNTLWQLEQLEFAAPGAMECFKVRRRTAENHGGLRLPGEFQGNRACMIVRHGLLLVRGLVFLVAGGIVIAPLFHRLLHRFHFLEESGRKR